MDGVSNEIIFAVRQYLRINHTHFDGELSDLVAAAKADLQLAGVLPVKAEDESDPLIKRAIVCYVKAEFGLDNADAEKYRSSYQTLKQHLTLSSEYITAKE